MAILNSDLLYGTVHHSTEFCVEILKELEGERRSGRTDGRTDRRMDARTQWPMTIPVGADGGRW